MAYGLCNTLYYTFAFLLIWFTVAKVPSGQGLAGSAKATAATFALVWAGSQISKIPRAAAALLAAPIVDVLLEKVKTQFKLDSKRDVSPFFLCVSADGNSNKFADRQKINK